MSAARLVPHPEAFTRSAPRGQRRPRVTSAKHLEWIRTLPCLIHVRPGVEAAHIRMADPRFAKRHVGTGEKPSDWWTVPLCSELHRLDSEAQHKGSEREFWQRMCVDPCIVAIALWANSGDNEAAAVIMREARTLGMRGMP